MKKSIWLAAGVAGMLLGNAATEADAAGNAQIYAKNGRSFVIESRPNFIMLPEQGFSVAVGSRYDIVFFDNRYYINQNGAWYRSSNYHGPWKYIRENNLPSKIRRHSLDDIRRFRDNEYNRNNHTNRLEQQRNDENSRRTLEQQRSDENNKRVLDQQRGDENNKRLLDQQRSDENNKRLLDQQRSDENNRRTLEQQRSDENRKR
jgi:hydroxymethylpyrimidine pyrophosphatase-like HAD family hydrolase